MKQQEKVATTLNDIQLGLYILNVLKYCNVEHYENLSNSCYNVFT